MHNFKRGGKNRNAKSRGHVCQHVNNLLQ